MTLAPAITTAKVRHRVKLTAKSLSDSAFSPVNSLTKDYASDKCPLQEIINMPVPLFITFKVATYSGFKPAHS